MSVIFDIPFQPSGSGEWLLIIQAPQNFGGDNLRPFPSRRDALSFAVQESLRRDPARKNTLINVEGADGKWRSFTQAMLPV